jgi:hypothetical protein
MEKVVRVLQYMWLTVAVVSFCIGCYHLLTEGVSEGALLFFFFAAMATLLFFVRKKQLKRFENMSK